MVITITTDEISTDDNETRARMRKRFQEIDEQQRKREEAGAAWVFVGYFGFLITFFGAFMMLAFLGIIPLTLEVFLSAGVILLGVFFMAIAGFLKNSPNIVMAEM
ncbi:MAG: hypothetical protein RTU30_03715 [Candidatus Thorarchaeota archaeon]